MGSVLVVGSINMDAVAIASRHPRHGETVKGSELRLLPGGKGANQAVAARRAGAPTSMVGRLGDDAFGQQLTSFLDEEGIDLSLVSRVTGVSSGTALIVVADGENTITMIPGANDALAPDDVHDLPAATSDVVVAQLEVPLATVAAAFEAAKRVGATTVLNAAPASPCGDDLLRSADVLVVNETELSQLVDGKPVESMSPTDAVTAAARLRRRGDQAIVVTLGRSGVVALDGVRTIRIEGHEVDTVDTTGAGDCFVGYLAAGLSRGVDLEPALESANIAASICVQALGAAVSVPRLEDVFYRDRTQQELVS